MPTVGTTVRCSAIAENFNGDECINTWDCKIITAGTGGTTAFREDARDWIETLYNEIESVVAATVSPTEIRFYAREGTEFIPPIAWNTPSFDAIGEELPAQLSAYLIGRTSTRGIRARKFIFPGVESANAGGLPTAGYLAILQGMADLLLVDFTGTNGWVLRPVVWSTTLFSSVEFVDATVSEQWGTQRRRRVGRGS